MKRARKITIVALALAAALLVFAASAAWATRPSLLWQLPEAPANGAAAGEIDNPRAVAADPGSGNVYIADGSNSRIDEFGPWGEFIKAFGWKVDASNPEEKLQLCTAETGCQAGSEGLRPGQLLSPRGLAVDSKGNLYVTDSGKRIQKFDSEGKLQLVFGGDVVAEGPDDSSVDEEQQVRIAAAGGTFKLRFTNPFLAGGTEETPSIPYNASTVEVKAALEGLSLIGGQGGSVTVSGGPGDATGSSPYLITFKGSLGGDDIPQLGLDTGHLAIAVGTELKCTTTTSATTLSYAWLRNGAPIPGATSSTYTTQAADEGKAIQCQLTAQNSGGGSIAVANPAQVVAPNPGTDPPSSLGGPSLQASKGLNVGETGGQELTCLPNSWSGSPSFAYQWYRNGAPIAGATSSTYTVQTADIATAAAFQCSVTGTNAGGATTRVTSSFPTFPPPENSSYPRAEANLPVASTATTVNQGGAGEVCKPTAGDVCKAGVEGSADGKLSNSSFSDPLATGPGDTVYVGDVGKIQKFDSEGKFVGKIEGSALSERTVDGLEVDSAGNAYVMSGKQGKSFGEADVLQKLGPTGATLATFPTTTPEGPFARSASGNVYVADYRYNKGDHNRQEERVVEFDATGNVLVPNAQELEKVEEAEEAFEPLPPAFAEESGYRITGLANSSACGIEGEDLYVTYFGSKSFFENSTSLVRAYGPHPDPNLCTPPERPPFISQQYATKVDTDSATLGAKISSNFWPTTTYYVEWGTGKCSEGGCENQLPLAPGAQLGSETNLAVAAPPVFLAGLQPDTTYHYRFVARTHFDPGSGGVAEVRGVGGKVGEPGEEATFTTPSLPSPPKSDCPNQAYRTAASAFLPDCRAYEMVSPIDKEGGDVLPLGAIIEGFKASLGESSEDGEKLTYSAYRPFAGSVSSPYTSQYLASRGPSGWSGEQISPPRGRMFTGPSFSNETEYKTFSPDLCHGWLRLEFEAEPQLDPAELSGFPNLFRRDECGGAASYEALITSKPQHAKASSFFPELQGTSADGRCAVFRSQDALSPEAPYLGEALELYETCEGTTRLVSFLPSGKPYEASSTAGTGEISSYVSYQNRTANVLTATSADGSRVYWTAADTGPGKIYLRINARQPQSAVVSGKCTEPEKACTLPVSEKASSENATFWVASADGSRAFFITAAEKLYEYDATEIAKPKATLIASGVEGIMGASANATRVYFASSKALAAGAVAGQPNLYFRETGSKPILVGTLSDADVNGWEAAAIAVTPFTRDARVSPDGLHAAFVSVSPALARETAGYDNTDQANGEPDGEVYLYDAGADEGQGKLICASCDPSGVRPTGRNIGGATGALAYFAAARISRWTSSLYASHALSADGTKLFFDSFVPLVGRDANGKADVYEWEPAPSSEACQELGGERFSPASEGCLSLISSGESSLDSEFLDASANGSDVFFTTASSLLTQDPGLIDVYDAREGGGFPAPPSPPAGCEGEACQGAPAPPNDPTPASSAFEGKGNVKQQQRHCLRGRVLRKGRCVKKHQAKHRSKRHRANATRRNHR